MGGAMSRNKGQRAERAVIGFLQPVVSRVYEEAGVEVPVLQRNTLQSDRGGYDVVGLDWLALEVKHQEQLAVEEWWKQTLRQARDGQCPVLFYKRNQIAFRVRLVGELWIFDSAKRVRAPVEVSVEAFLIFLEMNIRRRLGLPV